MFIGVVDLDVGTKFGTKVAHYVNNEFLSQLAMLLLLLERDCHYDVIGRHINERMLNGREYLIFVKK